MLMAERPRADGAHVSTSVRPVSIAVLIPCYNEQAAIARVVRDFRQSLPEAAIYVYDNNSVDGTVEEARCADAVVRHERLQGKGNVVRRMFADIEADVYVLVDGDATYHAPSAPIMVRTLIEGQYDMVNGQRVTETEAAYRVGHRFGNKLLTWMVSAIFGNRFTDILSGYRAFSRRFVKSFPALATGFEIETELTIHALELRMPTVEIPTPYKARPAGSASKLRTFRDGLRIIGTIMTLIKEERPFGFFGVVAALLLSIALILAVPIFQTYFESGVVPRLPTAILSTGIVLLAFINLACGLVVDTVTLGRREAKRMRYLQIPAPGTRR